jgi:hypothetical protein
MEQQNNRYPLMRYWILLLVLFISLYSSLIVNEKLNNEGKPWISAAIIYIYLSLISIMCCKIKGGLPNYYDKVDREYCTGLVITIPICGWMSCMLFCSTPIWASLTMIVPTAIIICIANSIKRNQTTTNTNIHHMKSESKSKSPQLTEAPIPEPSYSNHETIGILIPEPSCSSIQTQ